VKDDQVAEFIEGFALQLNDAGMQRMAARVFAALLTAPEGGHTAREIAERLGVSAAAVSGATNYLTRTGLAQRVRVTGDRVDHFNVHGTTWAEAMAVETAQISALGNWLDKGVTAVEDDGAAHARMTDTRDFFRFMAVEMPKLVDRWHASRRA
jgi:DNA-binding transcriptional regulator GbsR (MarR family)